MEEIRDKRIAVIGMARSGLAAADVLAARGARVMLIDTGDADKLADALAWAAEQGIEALHSTDRVPEGIDLVVTSPGVRKNAPVLAGAVERGIPVWGEIEMAYRIARAPILAITGTNGKTTTTAILGEMAKAAGKETYVAGNIAAGEIAMPLIRAADQASPEAVIVAEISSFQLEWTPTFRPKVGAILNITEDHVDRQTHHEYVAAKWNLLANQLPTDFAVLGEDLPAPGPSLKGGEPNSSPLGEAGRGLAAAVRIGAGRRIYFQRESRPEWIGDIQLPGEHNGLNMLAATVMARCFGLPEEAIREAGLAFTGVVHRLEYVATIGGVRWINNSMCTNNAAYETSLAALPGDLVVLSGGVYKGGDTSALTRALESPAVRELIVFGKSAQTFVEASKSRTTPARVVTTLDEAVKLASSVARPGETVVLNPGCASFDQFKDFEDRGDRFKALVRSML